MSENILKTLMSFAETALPILLTLFILVLFGIFITRMVLRIMLHFARKKYDAFKEKRRLKKEAKNFLPKEDEELMKVKAEKIASYQSPNIQKMPSLEEESEREELDEVKIVDIVKPVGFFTSMILGQKLTYLVSSAQIMNKNSHKGFWVSMVEAQERAQGRQKGRSL